MQLMDGLKVSGWFWFQLYNSKGELKEERLVPNAMTTTGLASVAALLVADKAFTGYDYIAYGTGVTAVASANTALEAEVARMGTSGTVVTTTSALDTGQFVSITTFGASFAITEAGVLNASSSGNLLCRQTFAAINVVSGDSLQVTYKVKAA